MYDLLNSPVNWQWFPGSKSLEKHSTTSIDLYTFPSSKKLLLYGTFSGWRVLQMFVEGNINHQNSTSPMPTTMPSYLQGTPPWPRHRRDRQTSRCVSRGCSGRTEAGWKFRLNRWGCQTYSRFKPLCQIGSSPQAVFSWVIFFLFLNLLIL